MRTSHLLALILSTVATAASAQAVRTERNMSL
ncbi:MAG: heme-binding protein, partial [Betaproteobacteria bacterium]|nr:heme-binding protein [Betaproteobacteria bacterium]